MNSINEETNLQLLVDGELEHGSRSEWLDSLDADSEVWRRIALGFVENQILNESLARSSATNQGAHITEQVYADRKPKVPRYWIAMAACLLVGLAIGSFYATAKSSTSSQVAHQTKSSSEVANKSESSQTGQVESLLLSDALARSVTPVSINARRALLKAGYFIDEGQEIATVELPTGKSIQMPVRQVNIRYLGAAAYQ